MRKYFPWILLVLIHGFVAFAGFRNDTLLTVDSDEYLLQAKNLREHFTYYCGNLEEGIRPEWYSLRPPGYGFFLMLVSFFSSGYFLPVMLQILFSLVSVIVCKWIAETITKSEIPVWLYLFPLTAFLPQFIYSGMIMSEILLQLFLVIMVYSGIRFHHSVSYKWCVIFQVTLTISFLIKPVMWLFPLLMFPFAIWMVWRKGYSGRLLLTFIIPFSVIVGINIRNYQLTGVTEYTSVSRKLLVNYNIPPLLEKVHGRENAIAILDSVQSSVSAMEYKQRALVLDSFTFSLIRSEPLYYFSLHLKGLLKFFMDTGRWEWSRYFGEESTWRSLDDSKEYSGYLKQWTPLALGYQLYCMFINLILVYALIRFAKNREIDYRDRRVIAGLILYLALIVGPSASARFRIPVFPLQMITWGVFIVQWRKPERTATLKV